ncbi:hypothetical protein [Mycobacterium camsae]|uniref:hypothetical protein n=1 Tax=Mycobacterium gordonae TaxID=1778 RepID=UPI002402BDD6|nr:hypothetical protein [Mycobacterium gordonae]
MTASTMARIKGFFRRRRGCVDESFDGCTVGRRVVACSGGPDRSGAGAGGRAGGYGRAGGGCGGLGGLGGLGGRLGGGGGFAGGGGRYGRPG